MALVKSFQRPSTHSEVQIFSKWPVTREPVLVLTRIAVRISKRNDSPESDEDLELRKELLESSGFKDDEMPWCSYYRG